MFEKKFNFGQKPRCPSIFDENRVELGNNGTFSTKNGGASRFLPKIALFLKYPLDHWQNYKSTWAFLKILPLGRKRGHFPRDLAAKSPKRGETVTKKGEKISLPTKFVTSIRCEI